MQLFCEVPDVGAVYTMKDEEQLRWLLVVEHGDYKDAAFVLEPDFDDINEDDGLSIGVDVTSYKTESMDEIEINEDVRQLCEVAFNSILKQAILGAEKVINTTEDSDTKGFTNED